MTSETSAKDGLQSEHLPARAVTGRSFLSWWRDSANVAAVAALLGAAMAAGAWINSCYSLDLEREKHLAALRLEFLDRALDSSRDPAYRAAVLRLLVVTLDKQDPLREWALEESAVLRELDNLRSQVRSQSQELARLRSTAQTSEYRKQASRLIETFAKLASVEREHGKPSEVFVTTITSPEALNDHVRQNIVLRSNAPILLQLELPEAIPGRKHLLRLLEAKTGELWRGEAEESDSGSIIFATPPGFFTAGVYVIEIYDSASPSKMIAKYHLRVEDANVQPAA